MSGIGTGPEETATYLDEHGEFAGADLIRTMAAETQRLIGLIQAGQTATCPCYPNPFDHEDHCPRRQA